MPNNYVNFLRGNAGETWIQALDRFASFCLNLHEFDDQGESCKVLFDIYYQDGTLFEWLDPVSETHLRDAETKLAFVMPSALRGLFARRFAIYDVLTRFGRWGDRRVLEIHGPYSVYTCLRAFCPAIAWNYGDDFTQAELSAAQVAHLNATYYCFGQWSDDDHEVTYLLVDRLGGFGHYHFDTADYPGSLERLAPLLRGEALTQSLDEVLVWAIDNCMAYLLARNDVLIVPDADG